MIKKVHSKKWIVLLSKAWIAEFKFKTDLDEKSNDQILSVIPMVVSSFFDSDSIWESRKKSAGIDLSIWLPQKIDSKLLTYYCVRVSLNKSEVLLVSSSSISPKDTSRSAKSLKWFVCSGLAPKSSDPQIPFSIEQEFLPKDGGLLSF